MQSLSGYLDWYWTEFDRARRSIEPNLLERLLTWLEETRRGGHRLFVVGNGGSAAAASHWACDFGKNVNSGSDLRLAVLNPADQVAWFSALANDVSYADALAEQLHNWIRPGDLLVALSVSGDSENLVRAFSVGRQCGARLVALVGQRKGRLASAADLALVIASEDYGIVEDLHIAVNHILSQYMKSHGSVPVMPQ